LSGELVDHGRASAHKFPAVALKAPDALFTPSNIAPGMFRVHPVVPTIAHESIAYRIVLKVSEHVKFSNSLVKVRIYRGYLAAHRFDPVECHGL
jgi:hypothetical protein